MVTLTFDLITPQYIGIFPFHGAIMWPSLVKIQYTELKLSCGNDPVVKNYIYSNLDLWPNNPTIYRVFPLPQGNHVAKFGKDPIYRTKVIVWKPVWTPTIPNHIIRPVSRRAYKKGCTQLVAASDKVYQLLAHGRWFSPGTLASSTTKTGRYDIAEILLKVALKHTKKTKKILDKYYIR
jgi:hypothetical protein